MLEKIFGPERVVILPLPDNHVKRNNARISTFHLDEARAVVARLDFQHRSALHADPPQVPGKSVNEAKHLLVNEPWPAQDFLVERKQLLLSSFVPILSHPGLVPVPCVQHWLQALGSRQRVRLP